MTGSRRSTLPGNAARVQPNLHIALALVLNPCGSAKPIRHDDRRLNLLAKLDVPLLGELHLPSAFFFDLGVFALVVGATGLLLIALAHQSVRR